MRIDNLHSRIRDHIWIEDQLYKDHIRVEKHFKRQEERLKQRQRKLEEDLQLGNEKISLLQNTIKTLETRQPDHINDKFIDLMRQNSIVESNLLRLTKKYTILEEQEKMLRRDFHNKDLDQATKDIDLQQRINDLKRWKAEALSQMQMMFQKLRNAVPLEQLEDANK